MNTNSEEAKCPKCGASIPEDAPQQLCPACVLIHAETLASGEASPGRKDPPQSLDELSPHFPDLEILELIGTGGMGSVYKARQPHLDRLVALKVLSHDLAGDPAFAERFGREARVLAKLSHPNIVAVYDSGTKGPFCYLLMEYVDGVNLRQAMRSGGFSPTESLTVVEDICAALKFAHGKGILHRDIKPENVLIDADGEVKIADFGIAKLVDMEDQHDVTLTFTGSILGSPQYMAPEQIESPGDVDQRADIYSLGVVLYEMLTGELPLGRFALPSEKVQLDARIDEIVLRTLEKEREARFQSADEVRTSVEAVRTSPGSVVRAEHPGSPPETARFAITSAILAGLSLLGASIFAAFFAVPGVVQYGRNLPNELITVFAVWWIFLVGVPGFVGTFLGMTALEEIRRSDGRTGGFGSALFGAVTFPGLVIAAGTIALMAFMMNFTGYHYTYPRGFFFPIMLPLLTGIAVLLMATRKLGRWGRGFRRSGWDIFAWLLSGTVVACFAFVGMVFMKFSDPAPGDPNAAVVVETPNGKADDPDASVVVKNPREFVKDQPKVELGLTVAPGLLATYKLVRRDAVGKERVLGGHEGFILTADQETWRGRVEHATVTEHNKPSPAEDAWPLMMNSIISDSPTMELLEGDHLEVFDPAWQWKEMEPIQLELSGPGQHDFSVASRSDRSESLFLRVEARRRSVPGVPAAVLDQVALDTTVCSPGKDIDWIRYLMEAAEKQMEAARVPGPVREPEPEWRNGHPEKHCNFTVPAGMVATFKLQGANDEIHQQGYIVASDLEDWEGKLRIGSLADRSVLHMRLEGPFNTITATIEKPDIWVLEPDAYTQTLDDTKTIYITFLGRIQPDDPSNSRKEFLKLALKVERRKYTAADAGLPDVLAFHHMALGKAPDWIEGVKRAIEMTDQPQPGRSR